MFSAHKSNFTTGHKKENWKWEMRKTFFRLLRRWIIRDEFSFLFTEPFHILMDQKRNYCGPKMKTVLRLRKTFKINILTCILWVGIKIEIFWAGFLVRYKIRFKNLMISCENLFEKYGGARSICTHPWLYKLFCI